jgi:hypothetical protein
MFFENIVLTPTKKYIFLTPKYNVLPPKFYLLVVVSEILVEEIQIFREKFFVSPIRKIYWRKSVDFWWSNMRPMSIVIFFTRIA